MTTRNLSGWLLLALGACGIDTSPIISPFTAPLACVQSSDCGAGLECEHGACRKRAEHGSDQDDAGLSATTGCTLDADCGAGFECEHGTCAPHGGGPVAAGAAAVGCSGTADCAAGLECERGVCAPHGGGRAGAGGAAAGGVGAAAGSGGAAAGSGGAAADCSSDLDCAAGMQCDDRRCKPHVVDAGLPVGSPGVPCRSDAECSAGLECEDGVCEKHGGKGRH